MSISIGSYEKDSKGIEFDRLPPVFKDADRWMIEAVEYYNESPVIKRIADKYISELNAFASGKVLPPEPQQLPDSGNDEAGEAIEFLSLLMEGSSSQEKKDIKEAIDFIKMLS